jgi:hypothetical protein
VEDSVGFWDTGAVPFAFHSLPGECAIYPFMERLLHYPAGEPMPLAWPTSPVNGAWLPPPAATATGTAAAAAAATVAVSSLEFLRGRWFLLLSDSIDRMLVELACDIRGDPTHTTGNPSNYVSFPPSLQVSQRLMSYAFHPPQGVRVCQIETLPLLLTHAMTMGVTDTSPAALPSLLESLMPLTLREAAALGTLTPSRPPLTPRAIDELKAAAAGERVPDLILIHSCAWDWDLSWLMAQEREKDAMMQWIKMCEQRMLLPTLEKYSAGYRQWREAFVRLQWQKLSSSAQAELDARGAQATPQPRTGLQELDAQYFVVNTTQMLVGLREEEESGTM